MFMFKRATLLAGLAVCVVAPTPAAAADPTDLTKAFANAERLEFAPLAIDKLAAEDAITDKIRGLPQRIAVAHDVALDAKSAGSWTRDGKGRWVWTLAVDAAEATHLSFGFDRFNLSEGAALDILAVDGSDRLGPYTTRDRLDHGQLWTPVLMADKALIRVRMAPGSKPELDLSLARIAQGYRGFGAVSKACKSGSCNTDVACLAASDPWNQPRRAVAAYTLGGVDQCTGSLVNNTANDGRMLFATATHCQVTSNAAAASVVAYWLYESPTCRVPGSTTSGVPLPRPSSRTSQGLRFLAATPSIGSAVLSQNSDWTLIELASPPAGNDFQLFWAGWDRRPPPQTCSAPAGSGATDGLCATIHHPAVDEKRITFVESAMTQSDYNIRGSVFAANVHWFANWDPTPPILANMQPPPASLPPSVTEGGSSGSPLFNADRRIVGVLSGGLSACGVPPNELNDFYGGLFHAWEGLGSAATRMRDHLDPLGSAPLAIDGLDSQASFDLALSSAGFDAPVSSGDPITVSASASGGSAPYTFDWDVDGDGSFERSGSAASIAFSVPRKASLSLTVRARDSGGAIATAQRTLSVRGPQIVASSAGAATEACGNGDANIDPGERWNLPVRLQNSGDGALDAGYALFAADSVAAGGLELGPNGFGYVGTGNPGACPYGFVDIASGSQAVAALATRDVEGNGFGDNDDARTLDPIALGGEGVLLFGTRYTQAVMSTNGYVAFDPGENGGQFGNSCDGRLDIGSLGPQLQVLHDDLVVGSGSAAGLRYRYFDSCPRAAQAGGAQGCHVFQWNGMAAYVQNGPANGDFAFQAVVYAQSGQVVYQYQNADPAAGGSATLGLLDADGEDPFNFACNSAGSVAAQRAYCGYAPNAQPSSVQPLRLPQAAAPLSGLGAGQAQTINVLAEIAPEAACGSAFELDYLGAADGPRGSFQQSTAFAGSVAASCSVVSSCPASATPVADPRRGLYFNPARPGNGMNGYLYPLDPQRQFFGGLWYTAETNASPIWYLVAGEVRHQAGELPLVQVRNSAAPDGFAIQSEIVGRAWMAQLDEESLLLAWKFNDGRSGIERMTTSQGLPFAAVNHTQAWFHPAEDGWGLAIESLDVGSGDFEFFASYIFDAEGLPRWVIGDKNSTASGTLNLFGYDVHCPGCPWYADAQDRAKAAGSLSIQYGSRSSATLSTDISLPAPLSGSWRRTQIPLQPIAEPQP